MKILCYDIGGTNVKYGILDENACILEKGTVPSGTESLEEFEKPIREIYQKYENEIDGVSFSMPGVIEPKTGYFFTGGAFTRFIHNINMKQEFSNFIHHQMSFANDARCAAHGELGYGCLKDVKDAIVFVIGTGIGGCLIKDHEIVYGKHLASGEFSYINMTAEMGEKSMVAFNCGIGSLQNLVAKNLETEELLNGYQIFELAEQGNEKVLKAIHDYCYKLAVLIYNLQAIYDPDVFAIGGGISAQRILLETIKECFYELKELYSPHFLAMPEIIPCRFRNDANLIGALHNYIVENCSD